MDRSILSPQATTPAVEAFAAIAATPEFAAVWAALNAEQRAADADGSWDTDAARRAEAVRGHLMMALEAAGFRL